MDPLFADRFFLMDLLTLITKTGFGPYDKIGKPYDKIDILSISLYDAFIQN